MCVCRSACFNLFNRHVLVRAAAALAGWTGIREVGDSASDAVKNSKKMNFCQINVSEYFVIANDAWRTIKTEEKRNGKKGEKKKPGKTWSQRARLYKIFARKRLFGDFYARLCVRAPLFSLIVYFSLVVYLTQRSFNNTVDQRAVSIDRFR